MSHHPTIPEYSKMSNHVAFSIHTSVIEGRLDDARSLMADMVESTREEVGTLGYEWFLNESGTECHMKDRYAGSEVTPDT